MISSFALFNFSAAFRASRLPSALRAQHTQAQHKQQREGDVSLRAASYVTRAALVSLLSLRFLPSARVRASASPCGVCVAALCVFVRVPGVVVRCAVNVPRSRASNLQ
jgi:hypothetical protein